jgi:hypothetical protein
MVTDRQIRETVARCVSAMVSYHDNERGQEPTDRMTAEVLVIAGWVEEMGLGAERTDRLILRPVGVELIGRYGPEVGHRLFDEFLDAFEGIEAIKDRHSP